MKRRNVPIVWSSETSEELGEYARLGHGKKEAFYDPEKIKEVRKVSESLWTKGLFELVPSLKDILVTPELVKLAESILGPGVYIHQSKLNYKRANSGGGFFWHSDFTVWNWEDGMPSPRCVLFMIPLDKITWDNGPLAIVAGSHNYYDEFLQDQEDLYSDYGRNITECTPDQLGMLDYLPVDTLLGDPGDLFYFDSNALHASEPNLSSKNRLAALVVINSIHNKLKNPLSGEAHRPDFVSNKDHMEAI
jgi:ectoine hydroxylase